MRRALTASLAIAAFWALPGLTYWLHLHHPAGVRALAAVLGVLVYSCALLLAGAVAGLNDRKREITGRDRRIARLEDERDRLLEEVTRLRLLHTGLANTNPHYLRAMQRQFRGPA